ncbi:LytR C-terminal domain-containing protein [Arthrobacter sp. CG_A4]|uniref:LytR C-terminal domain-containing protein n=1 Tax=Arthrobacter sp. CG_A4 TaxID=3071706 RepID=UPI002E0156B7|nr:hypothetical protein [Arthrobacter sp. CG_A4]
MTKYARDEFDRVPETSTRQGVHRAVAGSRRRRLGPILAVGATALAIGLVAFLILPKLGFSSPGNSSDASAGQNGSSATASAAAAAPTGSPSGAAPSPAPSASATPSDLPKAGAAVVDKTQPVAIYNGTATAGLAGRAGGTVTTAGWVLGPMGNWGGVRQQTSVIFYSSAAQKGNAEALGSLLGIQTMMESAEFKMPLVVVLGPGFQ